MPSSVALNLLPYLKLLHDNNCFPVSSNRPCFFSNYPSSLLSSYSSSFSLSGSFLTSNRGKKPWNSCHRPRLFSNTFQCLARKSEPPVAAVDAQTDEETVVVLVIGGGGREHALCYALQRSPSCDAVFCAPGNAGISNSGNATCVPDLDICDSSAVICFCHKWGVGLVVIGPEASY